MGMKRTLQGIQAERSEKTVVMSVYETRPSLLVRVRDPSDQAAWREFERKYRSLVLGYCRRRGLAPSDCDDVQQIVWLRLAEGLRKFAYNPETGRFRNYLLQVVRSAISRHFARPKARAHGLDTSMLAEVPDGSDETVDELWEQEWVDHHYRLAFHTIQQTFEPKSVEVFRSLLAGMSVADVANQFAMSAQAVYKVKQRVQHRMRELVTLQIQEEDHPEIPVRIPPTSDEAETTD
jgi:RNA polymerase sigma factor (sigma-70 family)